MIGLETCTGKQGAGVTFAGQIVVAKTYLGKIAQHVRNKQ